MVAWVLIIARDTDTSGKGRATLFLQFMISFPNLISFPNNMQLDVVFCFFGLM